MRRRHFLLGGLAAASAGAAGYLLRPTPPPPQVPVAVVPPALPDAEFHALLTTIRPAAGEDLFADIPWQTSLWDARRLAAKEGKPILLWEMDGHPLGCG